MNTSRSGDGQETIGSIEKAADERADTYSEARAGQGTPLGAAADCRAGGSGATAAGKPRKTRARAPGTWTGSPPPSSEASGCLCPDVTRKADNEKRGRISDTREHDPAHRALLTC